MRIASSIGKRFSLYAIALALLGGASIWLLDRVEFESRTVHTGYRGEARRNPWLAAERLLDRMGIEVHHLKAVPELHALPARAMLVLAAPRAILSAHDRERLLVWTRSGGHLVIESERLGTADPLLDDLKVARRKAKTSNESGDPFVFTLAQAPDPIKAQLSAPLSLEAAQATAGARNSSATLLLHFPQGKGRVTALATLSFARNRHIGEFNHAELLWQIARFDPRMRTAYFFDGPSKLSLFDWLREHAWTALAGLALLLTLWLWRIVPRFGARAPDPEPVRRRLLDHLRASGRFAWSRGGGDALAEAAREALLRRIARSQPDFAGLLSAEQEKRLIAQFNIKPTETRFILYPQAARRPDVFSGLIGLYQYIHEQLRHRSGKEKQ
ncbi:MAG: DUF4350 domain-containing protein [Betaproteobacteria bacterium]|nr:DUF4350 domain-containing protein [Betaproteobacteria bacterium]